MVPRYSRGWHRVLWQSPREQLLQDWACCSLPLSRTTFPTGIHKPRFPLLLLHTGILKHLTKPFSKGVFHLDTQMTCSVFSIVETQESYRLWFCKISNIIWKSCRTQTGWEGQQRLHRTMSFPTRAARDIAQYLGKKSAWDQWELPQHLCYTQNPDWKARTQPIHFSKVKKKKKSVKMIKVHLHVENTEKCKGDTHKRRHGTGLWVSVHFVWHLNGQAITYPQMIIKTWVYFLLADINITSQYHCVSPQRPLTSRNIHLQLVFHWAFISSEWQLI